MGGDHGPRCIVPACLTALARYPHLSVCLVGETEHIHHYLPPLSAEIAQRLSVKPACEVIEMDDSPALILRGKPDASMRVALNMVRDGEADGCLSAGNTGALMALSKHILKTPPSIERPAIMAALPAQNGPVHVLDLGANVDVKAEHLVQFAQMGAAAVELGGLRQPRVALLNIGTESIKGNSQVRRAAACLAQLPEINYIGYIEPDAVFRGDADVVVCDGFVGNVLLKGAEGVAQLMATQLRAQVQQSAWRRLLAWLGRDMWADVKRQWSPEHYNGALLLGVNGLVVKSHGSASACAFEAALALAYRTAQTRLPEQLGARLQHKTL